MNRLSRITNWNQAFELNRPIPCGDRIGKHPAIDLQGRSITVRRLRFTPEGARITPKTKAEIRSFVAFLAGRRQDAEWQQIAQIKPGLDYLVTPRHTHRFFKCEPDRFGHPTLFQGLSVLDIGSRVDYTPASLFKHYQALGASTIAFDLSVENPEHGDFCADARMIPLEDGKFDFITLPMIYGPCNPANTILEIAAGFSELFRVAGNGIVHIADPDLHPALIYIANLVGFRYFINPKADYIEDWNGIPVGALLVKKDAPLESNLLKAIIDLLMQNRNQREFDFSDDTKTDELPYRTLA